MSDLKPIPTSLIRHTIWPSSGPCEAIARALKERFPVIGYGFALQVTAFVLQAQCEDRYAVAEAILDDLAEVDFRVCREHRHEGHAEAMRKALEAGR